MRTDAIYMLRRNRVYAELNRPRYINCRAPFNPNDSALADLCRHGEGLKLCLGFLVDEYVSAIAARRGSVWANAAASTVDLFADTGQIEFAKR